MANEYYALQVGFSCAGQFALCEFHYRIADPTSPDDWIVAGDLIAALDDGAPGTSWLSRLRNMLSEDAFISSVRARRVGPTGGNTAGQTFTPTELPGTVASEIHSQQIAGCLIWVDGATPGKTGRNFIPGVPENAVLQSLWDLAWQALANLFIAKHITGHSTPDGLFLPVIFDRDTKTGPVIDDGYLSPKVGTQRRRELPV